MSFIQWVHITDWTLAMCYPVYLTSGFVNRICAHYGHQRKAMSNLLWSVTKWPALGHCLLNPFDIAMTRPLNWRDYLATAIGLAFWYTYRNDGDDDTTRKLRDSLTSKIQEIKGRLVVVPVPA